MATSSLSFTIKQRVDGRKFVVEMDADRFERVAAALGFFNPSFLTSIERAEADYRAGRVRHVASLRELRKKQ